MSFRFSLIILTSRIPFAIYIGPMFGFDFHLSHPDYAITFSRATSSMRS